MAATTMVRSRVDEDITKEAASVLDQFGLSVPDLIRMTLTIVAKTHSVPFELRIPQPNAETRMAMEEAQEMLKSGRLPFESAEALFDDLDKKAGK